MDAHSVVDDWDVVPFDGGYGAIDELASRGFDGAIEADGTWLFLRDGEALAVVSDLRSDPHPGEIDAFEAAAGQRYEAPDSTVATLAGMLALDGDVRGRYFSDDTPLEAVNETLSEGGFTGYVELSENVLSGDYYFVYVNGEVEHIGFVGSQVLVGEEAKSKADGEVGIYAVVAVELPRPELPEPPGSGVPETSTEKKGDGEADSDDDLESDRESDAEAEPDGSADEDSSEESNDESDAEEEPTDEARVASEETTADTDTEDDVADDRAAESDPSPEGEKGSSGTEGMEGTESAKIDDARSLDERRSPGDKKRSTAEAEEQSFEPPPVSSEPPAESQSEENEGDSGGIEAVTTRTVPSLDPENSARSRPSAETQTSTQRATVSKERRSESGGSEPRTGTETRSSTERTERLRAEYESQIDEYETQIDEYESRIDELETALADADSRVEALEAELESVRDERDELRRRIDAGDGSETASRSLDASEALAGTSLFIRENTRGEATLEDAHRGDADREAVTSNLRIEYHTTFEDEGVSIDGEPFESWLRSSDAYAFVEWLMTELLFEIRSTGATEGMRPLYDALPGIDRIGFEETIAVGDGTEGRETTFDIVARNKKGNPIAIVTFDRRRDPTRAEAIESLVTDASDVREKYDSLACAVAITSSYFESDAMATVEEATSTSLLSRSKHRSYVKLSRTGGYHFCLVETRDGSFNLTVPEL